MDSPWDGAADISYPTTLLPISATNSSRSLINRDSAFDGRLIVCSYRLGIDLLHTVKMLNRYRMGRASKRMGLS